MLEEFMNGDLQLLVDDITDKVISSFAKIVGNLKWVDGENIDGPFIRQHKDCYVLVEVRNQGLVWTTIKENPCMALSEFVYKLDKPIKIRTEDFMAVFEEG